MENIQSHQNPTPNFDKVITSFINNHIRFHTIQLFRKSGSTTFTPEGTGVLVEIFGIFCLFTSKHSVENLFESNLLYFNLGAEEYILITGTTDETETNTDNINTAYIILDLSIAESLTDIGYKFLSNDKILPYHQELETPQYTTVGFPKLTTDQDLDDIQTNGSYIISPMAPDNYYDNHIYTKDEYFIMPYGPTQEIMTSIKTKSKELFDMSGSGLWHISISKNHETIEYSYHLIGIITELYIYKRHQFLIASKINLITNQLKEAIS